MATQKCTPTKNEQYHKKDHIQIYILMNFGFAQGSLLQRHFPSELCKNPRENAKIGGQLV
jgi:hypothetical protein